MLFRSRPIVLAACLIGMAASSASAAPSAGKVAQPVGTLFHGNWCGLGDLNRGPALDALDAACRAHDLCYEREGRGACSCDRAFVRATGALTNRPKVADAVRSKAALANTLFAVTPCIETGKKPARARNR